MSAARAQRALDPRVERSKHVILLAALEELGTVGYGGFAIERVAARAGVGKSTIYRHWRDKLALIADAFQTLHEERDPPLDAGTPRENIERILRHVAEVVVSSDFSACMPALIDAAERDPELRKFHHHFQNEARRPLVALIAAGIASGDFPAQLDAELAASALLGTIFFRRLMTAEPFDPSRAGELVATVLGPPPESRAQTP